MERTSIYMMMKLVKSTVHSRWSLLIPVNSMCYDSRLLTTVNRKLKSHIFHIDRTAVCQFQCIYVSDEVAQFGRITVKYIYAIFPPAINIAFRLTQSAMSCANKWSSLHIYRPQPAAEVQGIIWWSPSLPLTILDSPDKYQPDRNVAWKLFQSLNQLFDARFKAVLKYASYDRQGLGEVGPVLASFGRGTNFITTDSRLYNTKLSLFVSHWQAS